jgi:hypothetical protein
LSDGVGLRAAAWAAGGGAAPPARKPLPVPPAAQEQSMHFTPPVRKQPLPKHLSDGGLQCFPSESAVGGHVSGVFGTAPAGQTAPHAPFVSLANDAAHFLVEACPVQARTEAPSHRLARGARGV